MSTIFGMRKFFTSEDRYESQGTRKFNCNFGVLHPLSAIKSMFSIGNDALDAISAHVADQF